MTLSPDYDVIIVGAGVSGIAVACHLKMHCPWIRFTILEGREDVGGTWDLFRYPGIRSDSDLFTFGYSFRPWDGSSSIAEGAEIKAYVKRTAKEFDVWKHIQFSKRSLSGNWDSKTNMWTVQVADVLKDGSTSTPRSITSRFSVLCTGYYDYKSVYAPSWPGLKDFKGPVIHPQFWDENFDPKGKKIAIIGSGATAVTLVPSLVERGAKQVTMVQRSPTYIAVLPSVSPIDRWLQNFFGKRWGGFIARWKHICQSILFYNLGRRFPTLFKNHLREEAEHLIGGTHYTKPHLTPYYNPYDQRVCVDKDGVFFKCLREKTATIATGSITQIRAQELVLENGAQTVEADALVTATGLKIQTMGGMKGSVDGKIVDPGSVFMYKGMMLSGVPNLMYVIGYTNNSWTLRCELAARHLCRILKEMKRRKATRLQVDVPEGMEREPLLDLKSGYVRRGAAVLPAQGQNKPWLVRQNYILDVMDVDASFVVDKYMSFA